MALTSQIDSLSTDTGQSSPEQTARVPKTYIVTAQQLWMFFGTSVLGFACGVAAIAVNGALR